MRALRASSTVLVTGSTSGIGLGIAQCIARWSPDTVIYLNGLGTKAQIEEAVKSVEAARVASTVGQTRFVEADLSTTQGAEGMISSVVRESGRLDVLVNNAGIQHVSPIDKFPVEMYDKIVAINLSAVFHTTRVALPHMKTQNFGRIINIASVHGLTASPNKSAYVACKHAVVGLTKTVALEVARTNITCNAVCPGWVLTPLVVQQIKDKMKALGTTYDEALSTVVGEKMPSRRPASIEEIGNACVYLASPSTVSTNGAMLNIDGGWVAGTVGASEPISPPPTVA